ncbi:restriction endonuclease [Bacillus thuringiensis]|nr:restriction endonuclease [Bacillus thuringiensis]
MRRKLVLKKIKDITKILTQREEVEKELKAIISKVVKAKKNLKSIDLKVNKQNQELDSISIKIESKVAQLKRVTEELHIKEQLLQNCVLEVEEKNIEIQKYNSIIEEKKGELMKQTRLSRKQKEKMEVYFEGLRQLENDFVSKELNSNDNINLLGEEKSTQIKFFAEVIRKLVNKRDKEEKVQLRLEEKQYRKEDIEFNELFKNFVDLHYVSGIIHSNSDELLLALIKGEERKDRISGSFHYQNWSWVITFYEELFDPFLHVLKSKNYKINGYEDYLVLTLKELALLKNFSEHRDEFIPLFNLSPEYNSIVDVIHKYISLVGESNINQITYLGFLSVFLKEKGFINYIQGTSELYILIKKEIKSFRAIQLETSLNKGRTTAHTQKIITIEDIDLLSGEEFEQYLADLLKCLGFRTELTKGSGDQGADILGFKQNKKYVIQAKRYKSTVGTAAVQEVVAGKAFYDADESWVITNSTFTKGAVELASKTNTKLWDREKLSNLIETLMV